MEVREGVEKQKFKFKIFMFNDTATTEIYTGEDTLSLHDALPIYVFFTNKASSNNRKCSSY